MADNVKDPSSEPDTVEKRPLTLDKLPVDVLEYVTGWLSLADCLVLRKVSRDLRGFVDSTDIHCRFVCFQLFRGNWIIDYEESQDGGCKVISNMAQKYKTYRDDRNYKQVMFADASTFLKMPKLQIGHIGFRDVGRDTGLEFIQYLKSRNFRLNVRSIRSGDLEFLHSIQEYLKLEKLEEILYNGFASVTTFHELAATNMEILKNPKLKFEGMYFDDYSDDLSTKFLEILKSINSQLNIRAIFLRDARWIPTILQSLNPEKVEDVKIEHFVRITADQFNEIAGVKQWKTKTRWLWCHLPEEIELQQLVDFKKIQSEDFEFNEENLIVIRDILLKSPHLDSFQLKTSHTFVDVDEMRDMNETIDRIMSLDPAYDVATRRFSIPNSRDYFQLELNIFRGFELVKRVSPK